VRRAADALVTGMGFCLPGGPGGPVSTAPDLWEVIANGRSTLDHDGFFHGLVDLPEDRFEQRLPEIPQRHRRHYAPVHHYGLLSLVEACEDAGLDFRAGDLSDAAVLTARAGVDSTFDSYLAWYEADPERLTPQEAKALFVRLVIAGTANDVVSVQTALTRSTGPSYTVTCGCASSAVLLGIARRLIEAGDVHTAVVTGVDAFDTGRMRHADRLRLVAERDGISATHNSAPPTAPRFDHPMRPYDERSDCVNFGDGSVTLILESREHAERRGARPRGRIAAQATTRGGLPSAVSIDDSGLALAAAVRACTKGTVDVREVPYINGGAEGDPLFTLIEANAVRELYGSAGGQVLVSSQEACFGHSGAPLGNLGVAATLLMMENGQVCPTANCEQPAAVCTFDPVPGTRARPLAFDRALSFNYQIGGVTSAILLEGPDVL
jgi:3-oxoacyl-[acyl-carrier-protein] synthase II